MRSRGFTLVELLVVLTIAAILVAGAVPSLSWFIASSRTANTADTMVAAFERASSLHPTDRLPRVYVDRCGHFIEHPQLAISQCRNVIKL